MPDFSLFEESTNAKHTPNPDDEFPEPNQYNPVDDGWDENPFEGSEKFKDEDFFQGNSGFDAFQPKPSKETFVADDTADLLGSSYVPPSKPEE